MFRQGKRRILRKFRLDELAAVDVPAQREATAVLMKRAEPAVADPRSQLAEILKHAPRLATMPAADDPALAQIKELTAQLADRHLDPLARSVLRVLLQAAMADLAARVGVVRDDSGSRQTEAPTDAQASERMRERHAAKAGDPRAQLAALLRGA